MPGVRGQQNQPCEEGRLIGAIAQRIPGIISPHHLTFVGLAGAVLVAAGFIATRWSNWFLALVAFGLAVNWLGDSLERAVSVRRGVTFHYYGYFINNSADLVAQTLMIMALGFSPYFTVPSALLVLSLYLLLSSSKYLLVVIHGDRQPRVGIEPKGVRLLVMGWSLSAALIGHELASKRILSFAALDVVVGGLSIFAFIVFILIVRRDLALVQLQEQAAAGDKLSFDQDEIISDQEEIISDQDEIFPIAPQLAPVRCGSPARSDQKISAG
ncbi:CDP-alcohol phosphatidyltransferase family protein [Methylocystis sp.]|uniref:CDP-alcohol phosphatidyltransferase family protein n=1 Tax=Methylocystis sp. TaxID=1911079 RepID=UPI003D0D8C50